MKTSYGLSGRVTRCRAGELTIEGHGHRVHVRTAEDFRLGEVLQFDVVVDDLTGVREAVNLRRAPL